MKMCNAFAANGHTVELSTAQKKGVLEDNITDVYEFYGVQKIFLIRNFFWGNFKGTSYLYALQICGLFFSKLFTKNRYEIVYGRFLLGCFLASLFGYKVIFELHAPVSIKKSELFFFRKLMQRKNTVRLVVISESLKSEIISTFPNVRDRIFVAHDGADRVDVGDKILLPKKDRFNVGYVGHLYKGRGIQLLLDLAQSCPWAELHIIGGTEDDIDFWKSKSAEIPNVTFYGFLPPKITAKYRNACDVLLAPYENKVSISGSSYDTSKWMSPLKIFEYMSANKPIICSDILVLHEILTNEKNAILCKAESLPDWKKALEKLKNDPALCNTLAQNAFNDFLQHYTWKTRAEKVICFE
jgi:glycosyltransferase involved in cell wall biosynthesis